MHTHYGGCQDYMQGKQRKPWLTMQPVQVVMQKGNAVGINCVDQSLGDDTGTNQTNVLVQVVNSYSMGTSHGDFVTTRQLYTLVFH